MFSQITVTGDLESIQEIDEYNVQAVLNSPCFEDPVLVTIKKHPPNMIEGVYVLVTGQPVLTDQVLSIEGATVVYAAEGAFLGQVTVFGYLGKPPELQYGQSSQKTYLRNSICVNEYSWVAKEVQKSWYNFVAFGKQAETIQKYLKQGSLVGLNGDLRQESYKDKKGNDKTTYSLKVDKLILLPKKAQKEATEGGNQQPFSANSMSNAVSMVGRAISSNMPF